MRRGPFSPVSVSYQVTWGAGEAWMVQVSRTVVRSQTAWERSGIQNQGPRPEHSSLSSLASRTFSSVWRQKQVCDPSEPGHQLPPIFTATSPQHPGSGVRSTGAGAFSSIGEAVRPMTSGPSGPGSWPTSATS